MKHASKNTSQLPVDRDYTLCFLSEFCDFTLLYSQLLEKLSSYLYENIKENLLA